MTGPRMTFEEVMAAIEEVARDGEGADKFRALKMLRDDRGTEAITLPPPLNEQEMIPRLARLMKPCGVHLCQLAFRKAFPRKNLDIDAPIEIEEGDVEPEARARAMSVLSLKHLYKLYPELKRSGVPAGYPKGKSIAAQREWCRRAALKTEAFRAQKIADQPIKEEPEIDDGEDFSGSD